MNIIEAHNINYKINNKYILKNIDFMVNKPSFISIIGRNTSGKTTLIKLLDSEIITNNNIKLNDIQINKYNLEKIYSKISIIKSYNEFFSKTVIEEILQNKRDASIYEINKVKMLLDEFNLLDLEKEAVVNLSYAENQIIALIKAIVNNPKIIFLDNAFSKLDKDKRDELYKYLNNYAKENNITIVSTTNNIEDIKYSDRVILLKNGSIKFDGSYDDLFTNIDLTKEGFKLPFEMELSKKLMLYELIDKEYNNIDDIVGELCKQI